MENLSVENNENRESVTHSLVAEIERERDHLAANPEIREHFDRGGATVRVRRGNFSDDLVAQAQLQVRAVQRVVAEIQKGTEGRLATREEMKREEIAAKLEAFYEAMAALSLSAAEAEDRRHDPEYSALAEHFESVIPSLKQQREKFYNAK